jgi:hypothetical protein
MKEVTNDIGERINGMQDEVAQASNRPVLELGGGLVVHDANSLKSLKAMKGKV